MYRYTIVFMVMIALFSGCSGPGRDFSDAQLEALHQQAIKESLIPIRPGQPEKRAFWNTHARRFIYAPAFNFKTINGAGQYRFTATSSANNKEYSFVAANPWGSLAPVWNELPVGNVTLKVEGIDAAGEIIGLSELADPACIYQKSDQSDYPKVRKFFRAAVFKGGYHDVPVGYRDSAVKALKYLYNEKHIQKWAIDGQPDPDYMHYCYPSKIIGAVIKGMILYSKAVSADAAKATKIAENAADYLIEKSQPAGTPLEYLPLTYEGEALHASRRYTGQMMMIYPAGVAETYLDLYEVTKKDQYLQAAKRIAATYDKLQLPSGTWYLKLDIETGKPVTNNVCVPTAMIRLFDRLANTYGMQKYRENSKRAFDWIISNPVNTFNWEGQFEDVPPSMAYRNLSHGQADQVAVYLLDNFADNDAYVKIAEELIRFTEDQFVIWENEKYPPLDKKDWISPCVMEQYDYYVPIDASVAGMISIYQKAFEITGKKLYLAKACALADSMIIAQDAQTGRYPTYWWTDGFEEEYWLNCYVYDVDVMLKFAQLLDKLAE